MDCSAAFKPCDFKDERAQGKKHMTDLFCGAVRQFFDLDQFIDSGFFIPVEHAARQIDAHGHGRNRLCRAVVQVTRQFLARFFMDFHHAFFFFEQILVQTGVLDGDHSLTTDHIQQVCALTGEIIGVGMGEQHRAINIKAAAQRETIGRCAIPQRNHTPQFRVITDIRGENCFTLIDHTLQYAFAGVQLYALIGAGQTSRGSDSSWSP